VIDTPTAQANGAFQIIFVDTLVDKATGLSVVQYIIGWRTDWQASMA